MFISKSLWEFKLSRDKKCDSAMKKLLYYEFGGRTLSYLTLTDWTKETELPLDDVVSCYTLSADGYRKL